MSRSSMVVSLLGLLAASSAFAGAKTKELEIITEPTATIAFFEDGGAQHPVNAVSGSWSGSGLRGPLGEVSFGTGIDVHAVIRAPGFVPVFREIDTGAQKVNVALQPILATPDLGRAWEGVRERSATMAKADAVRNNSLAVTDAETRALQAALFLIEGDPKFDAAKALEGANGVLAEEADAPTKRLAHATKTHAAMVVWRDTAKKAVAAGRLLDPEVDAARTVTLDAARAWIALGPTDPVATQICISALGTPSECGLSMDPLFR